MATEPEPLMKPMDVLNYTLDPHLDAYEYGMRELTALDRLTVLILMRNARNKDAMVESRSLPYLAGQGGMSVATLKRSLARLIQLGMIPELGKRWTKTGQRINNYCLVDYAHRASCWAERKRVERESAKAELLRLNATAQAEPRLTVSRPEAQAEPSGKLTVSRPEAQAEPLSTLSSAVLSAKESTTTVVTIEEAREAPKPNIPSWEEAERMPMEEFVKIKG